MKEKTALMKMTIKYITESEIADLERLNEVVYDWNDPVSIENYIKANSDFHMGIARASRNSRLSRHYKMVLDEAERLMYMDLKQNNILQTWHQSHGRMIEALRNRDEATGIRAIEDIMSKQKKRIFGVE
jgi:DNA-binding GntR family transcriptional regulator